MKKEIQKAFNSIRADQDLIDRTKSNLAVGRKSKTTRRSSILMRGLATAAAVLLLSGVFAIAGLFWVNQTVAAVSVDINPSIELGINALSRVVSVQALNGEGQLILAGIDLKNLPVKTAVGKIVSAAAKAGYLAKDGSSIIAITTSTDNESLKNQLEQETGAAAQQSLDEEKSEAVIYHDNTALARVAEARRLKITPGRLNLIQKLIALDPTKKVDDYLTTKMSDIMKEVVQLKKAQRPTEKDAAAATRETKKEALESEKAIAASARESEKTASESEKNATATADVLSRMEQALNQAQANQVRNKSSQK